MLAFLPLFAAAQSLPSIEEKTKTLNFNDGFMPFYWDANAGKIYLRISKLNTAILYQTSLPAGLGSNDIGLDRGLLGNTAIVQFNRVGNKVFMVQPNVNYRAITSNKAERTAVEQSFAQSILWGFVAEAQTGETVLVDATAFFLQDAMQVSARLQNNRQGNYTIDVSRSALYMPRTKNFTENTEVESTITFTTKDARPGSIVGTVAAAAEAITVRMHHSFVQLPDDNYRSRAFDPRGGFNHTSFYDYSTPVSEPINKYMINRHRLQKKDPNAALSEVVKPIVYYLDNGTPEPIRSALLEGAKWWAEAFESAGFKNAFEVKILPEDADPMDVRYNMINWVHRSTRGWSYGASVVDPRTGEIIKGNVTLGSLRVRQDYLIAEALLAPYKNGVPQNDPMLKMALQRLKQLAAHEIGHTLGLMHNYIASSQGRSSVMDYPAPFVTLDGDNNIDLSKAYTNSIGDWDKVSIAYGYSQFANGVNEQEALNALITNAAAKGLGFISDRDARDPGGLHPNAHLWDEGNNAVTGLQNVLKVRNRALENFGTDNIKKGMPMAMLEDALVPLYLMHRYQLEAAVKLVGGMQYNYALKGDGQEILSPIKKEAQQAALNAVIDCIDPKMLALPERITNLIPPRPAGYDYNRELFKRRTGLSFDPLAAAESAADFPLSLLFNPARLNRMVQLDAENEGVGIDEMLARLIAKTWKAPRQKGLAGLILQQNEQLLLHYLIAVSQNSNLSFASKAALASGMEEIKTMATAKLALANANTKGYLLMTLDKIENKATAKPFEPEPLPPGAPIGCDMEAYIF